MLAVSGARDLRSLPRQTRRGKQREVNPPIHAKHSHIAPTHRDGTAKDMRHGHDTPGRDGEPRRDAISGTDTQRHDAGRRGSGRRAAAEQGGSKPDGAQHDGDSDCERCACRCSLSARGGGLRGGRAGARRGPAGHRGTGPDVARTTSVGSAT